MDSKPLEFIQAIIVRMAGNSTQMKTWNVALATAAIGFAAAKDGKPAAAIYAVLPALLFWVLDGYYLALEVRFRELYEEKVNSGAPTYTLAIKPVDTVLLFTSVFRPAVFLIHAPVLGVIFVVTRA